jgi:hypothetical protein
MLFGGTRPTPENPAGRPGMTDSRITHCTLEEIGLDAEFGGGIRLAFGCDRNEVSNNRIDRTGRGGIFGDGAAELVVRRNRVTGSGGEGRGIEIIARDVVVSDNVVDGGAMIGLTVSNTRVKNNVLWACNTVRDCVQSGAEFQGESGGIAHHFFHDCRFEKTRKRDPRAGYPGADGHGFRTNGHCRGLVFEDCVFRDNGGYGGAREGSAAARRAVLTAIGTTADGKRSGLGWQTGWTPWWHWARRLPQPKRLFVERGAYRFLRHPVYLSFLGLIWSEPGQLVAGSIRPVHDSFTTPTETGRRA